MKKPFFRFVGIRYICPTNQQPIRETIMEGDIIIEQGGITVQMRELGYDMRDPKRRRQYMHRKTHVHVRIEDEGVLENLMNRRQRPYTTWKKELLPVVARMIKDDTGLTMDKERNWNQRLGCSCPCSPGFGTVLYNEEGRPVAYTVWVTIEKK
jgi:hypothetical protein